MKGFLQIGPEPVDGTQMTSSRASALFPSSPVVDIALSHERQFTTSGSASGTWDGHYVGPVLADVGSHLQGITIHALGRAFSTNFQYRVILEKSFDGETFTAVSTALLSAQTATGAVISAEFTTRTDFARYLRIKVEVDQTSGTDKEIGTLSLRAALRFFT